MGMQPHMGRMQGRMGRPLAQLGPQMQRGGMCDCGRMMKPGGPAGQGAGRRGQQAPAQIQRGMGHNL